MPMGGCMKFFTPKNTAGVSQEKGTAVISKTIKENGDHVQNVRNT